MTIKRIDARSLSRVLGILYAILGLVVGALVALVALMGFGFGGARAMPGMSGAMFGAMFGVGAVVVLPIFYGLIGFVSGRIVAALYNWVAGRFGGIVIETQ